MEGEPMKQEFASVAFQVLPWVEMDSLNPIVDRVIARIAEEEGIKYHVCPFETVMEGELQVLFSVIADCMRIAHEAGAKEVFSNVKILYHPEAQGTMLPFSYSANA